MRQEACSSHKFQKYEAASPIDLFLQTGNFPFVSRIKLLDRYRAIIATRTLVSNGTFNFHQGKCPHVLVFLHICVTDVTDSYV